MAERNLVDRMIGAAMLDIPTYEEVEADESLTGQAAVVVVLAAIAAGIGSYGGEEPLLGLGLGVVASLVGWALWAGVTYIVGDKLLGGTATWGELLRTLGYAQAPGVLYVLAIAPMFGGILKAVVGIWLLITGIVAIRQALDFGTGKALVTAFLGWCVALLPALLLGLTLWGAS